MRRMRRSGDPYADFDAWDREQQDAIEKYPICKVCGEHIQDEKCYRTDDRYFIHLDCVEEVYTDDYVDED